MRVVVVLVGLVSIWSMQLTPAELSRPAVVMPAVAVAAASPAPQFSGDLLRSPLTGADQDKIQAITTSEWLGPLAPIAISPFFGIACLAGLAQYGGDFMPANNFISNNAVLQNEYVFWVFAALALLTSLPRLTKVSKPFAQAMDMLETYGGIITIIILRFASAVPADDPMLEGTQTAMVQMGFMSFSADVLLSIAAIINIVVINSVKFFFEILVWLTPFPFVDALLEAGNKAACVGLMAIYAYSPMLATIFNLVLFAACLYVFAWTKRRVTYWRTMLTDPALALIWPSYKTYAGKPLIGFVKDSFGGMPGKSKVSISRNENGWEMREMKLLLPGKVFQLPANEFSFELCRGMFTNAIRSAGNRPVEIAFSKRFSQLDQVASSLQLREGDCEPSDSVELEFS